MECGVPDLAFVKDKRMRFELLDAGGWLDFAGGAWGRGRNRRRARCGRGAAPVAAGQGRAEPATSSSPAAIALSRAVSAADAGPASRPIVVQGIVSRPGRRSAIHSPILTASIFPPANGIGAAKAPLNA